MSRKNILVITVLVIFGVNSLIQAKLVPEFRFPTINIISIVGKWYLIASTNAEDQDICMSNTVEQYSNHNFTMYMNRVLKPDTRDNNTNLSEKVHNLTMKSIIIYEKIDLFHIMKNNSNVFGGGQRIPKLLIWTFSDPVGRIYLLFHTVEKAAQAIDGFDEVVFIFSREELLHTGYLEALERSEFYRTAANSTPKLFGVNPEVC